MFLIKSVYELTEKFPKHELYGLTSQMRRAAVSVSVNIAEGIGRNYKRDTIQFLHISRGSLYELDSLMEIASMLKMITAEQLKENLDSIQQSGKLINGLIKYFENANIK